MPQVLRIKARNTCEWTRSHQEDVVQRAIDGMSAELRSDMVLHAGRQILDQVWYLAG